MDIVLALAVLLHLSVLFFSFRFFHTDIPCREADRTIVATLCAASVGFLIGQGVNWWWHFHYGAPMTVTDTIFGAFSLFNGILYITLVRSFVQHRDGRCPFTPSGERQ